MNVEMKPLVSIIVPMFNSSNYIDRCIKSILGQKYTNFELLLIDDGSNDLTFEICQKYLFDKRIKLFKKSNSGVSSARNFGLSIFKGEYCTFVDSDDYVSDSYLLDLLKIAVFHNEKIVICKHLCCKSSMLHNFNKLECLKTNLIKVNYDENFIYNNGYISGSVWGILYHKSVLSDIKFDEKLYVGEDLVFFMSIFIECKHAIYIDKVLYIYVQYDESALHGKYSIKKMTEVDAWKKIANMSRDYKNANESALSNLSLVAFKGIRAFPKNMPKSILKYLIKVYRSNFRYTKKYVKDSKFKLKLKFVYFFPLIYSHLTNLKRSKNYVRK